MFTINGKPAYTKAYLLLEAATRGKCRVPTVVKLMESASVVHTESRTERQYPQELGPTLRELPPGISDRPLWLLDFGTQWVFVSPETKADKPEDLFPSPLADTLTFIDLIQARTGVTEIKITDLFKFKPDISVPLQNLTLEQTAQLVSDQRGLGPKKIELRFTTVGGLLGFVTYETKDGTLHPRRFHLCSHNLPYISYPLQPQEFGKVIFIPDEIIYDTAFELDMSLIP